MKNSIALLCCQVGALTKKTITGSKLICALFSITLAISMLPGTANAVPEIPTGLCMDEVICADTAQLPASSPAAFNAPQNMDPSKFNPGYYYSVGQTKNSPEAAFSLLASKPEFKGGKRVFSWKDLEPRKGEYDFSRIEQDLAYLQSIDKRLWIQVFYTQFNGKGLPQTPSYMWNDPSYGCGSEYYGTYKRETQAGGWIACYWNSNVKERLSALYTALGNRFNEEPFFEGISIDETAIDTYSARAQPGYDVDAIKETFQEKALAARNSFPDKIVIQQINFAPYDLKEFASWLANNNIGIGGPDVYLSNAFLLGTTYPQYIKYHNDVPTGIDVQWRNYTKINSNLGRANTPEEILLGAIEKTNPWYMFWLNRSPYFVNGVLPAIKKHGLPPAAKRFYDSTY